MNRETILLFDARIGTRQMFFLVSVSVLFRLWACRNPDGLGMCLLLGGADVF